MATLPQLRRRRRDLEIQSHWEQLTCPDLHQSSLRQRSRVEAVFQMANRHGQRLLQLCLLWC